VKGVVDFLFAVAAVGGDRPGWSAGSSGDPFDRRGKLWGVGRVALFDGEVQDHTVLVVSKLGLVTELDRLTQPALGDRAGVRVVQADPSGRSVRSHPGQPLPGLRGDLTRRGEKVGQVIDRAGEPPARSMT